MKIASLFLVMLIPFSVDLFLLLNYVHVIHVSK